MNRHHTSRLSSRLAGAGLSLALLTTLALPALAAEQQTELADTTPSTLLELVQAQETPTPAAEQKVEPADTAPSTLLELVQETPASAQATEHFTTLSLAPFSKEAIQIYNSTLSPSDVQLFGTESEPVQKLYDYLEDEIAKQPLDAPAPIDVSQFKLPFRTEEEQAMVNALLSSLPLSAHSLFYLGNVGLTYTEYNGSDTYITAITPIFIKGITEQDKQVFNQKVDEIVASVPQNLDTLGKVLYIHDYLVNNIVYNQDVASGKAAEGPALAYRAYGALVDNDAVCQGYTTAYSLLIERLFPNGEVKAGYVPSDQLRHVWNAILIDGQWYHVDATSDDPVPDTKGRMSYNHFLLSTEELKAVHQTTGWGGATDWYDVIETTGSAYAGANYLFNRTPVQIHIADDGASFYFIQEDTSQERNYQLYRASSMEGADATLIGDLGFVADQFGVAWDENYFYYLRVYLASTGNGDWSVEAFRYPLAGGQAVSLTDGPYIYTPQDAVFDKITFPDSLGLRVNFPYLDVISSTDMQEQRIRRIQFPYPTQWDDTQLSGNEQITIVGAEQQGNELVVGVLSKDTLSVFATISAYNADGKLVHLSRQPVTTKVGTLTLSSLPFSPTSDIAHVRIMLTDAAYKPLCKALTPFK